MTKTATFGTGRRESHDASLFYDRMPGIEEDYSEEPEVPPASVRNRFYNFSSEQMDELPDNCVGLMVTSPPYYSGKDDEGSWKSLDDYFETMENVMFEVYRVLEPGGRAVINIANTGRRPYRPLVKDFYDICLGADFFPRGEIIWVKGKGANSSIAVGTFQSAMNPVLRDLHETIMCFSKQRYSRARSGESTISKEDFLRYTLSVWEMRPESALRVGHPAPFPVELPRRFIELYSYKDDLILDPFAGSCTTAVAAKQLGRRFIMYDTMAKYLKIGRRRVREEA